MEAITLSELNHRIACQLNVSPLQNVWVTAELSDVAVRGGHCYMELLQKDEAGTTVAKSRAAIWANVFRVIRSDFYAATGQDFVSGLKVMVRLSVSMHPVYGLSLVINAVNPDYTMGDLLRRRREMLQRLKAQGIADINKSLAWNEPTLRIAIVSSAEAAGYGDFMNQLAADPLKLRFTTGLFPAIMQGERTPATVIAALKRIEAEQNMWDCVVIIRGGGSSSDLLSFENYDLAAAVAQFPLPIIVGIGHERDVTILDYVACQRVKTPTAAAEFLLQLGKQSYDRLNALGRDIALSASQYIAGCFQQLGIYEGKLPSLPAAALTRASSRVDRMAMALQQISSRRLQPQMLRLESLSGTLSHSITRMLDNQRQRLCSFEQLLDALSPQATLKRGYSITRVAGTAIRSAGDVAAGVVMETTLADGIIKSIKTE
ncbi:MAG: exodeoxyribonuclease VII large subunit [Muribaculum sp.]|nr:exodeoxyribonuclease VII large subunit [Muribaculaceae bacterium]MCM1080913.1 exodeoxyribonuclease VII large subunit [Muribaculum sp.]